MPDWEAILDLDTPLLEIIVRGTVVYLALFLMLRLLLKRQSGNVSITDLLVIVLIADAAQNAMSGTYSSVPDGILLVATIIFWSFSLDWLGYKVPLVGRLVHPPPLELVRDGREIARNMARELITRDELMSHLRSHGVTDVAQVSRAYLEGNGQISVLTREDQTPA